jgi:hypothetical protein
MDDQRVILPYQLLVVTNLQLLYFLNHKLFQLSTFTLVFPGRRESKWYKSFLKLANSTSTQRKNETVVMIGVQVF